jgi:hypothetical protein
MQSSIAIKRHFPDLLKMLSEMPDQRKQPQYKTEELLMAVITLFLLKRKSRNHFAKTANKGRFESNYERIFECKLPDLDTSNDLLKKLPVDSLEKLKCKLVGLLMRKKVFDKFRYNGIYHKVATDATGMYSFNYEPYPGCPKKTYEKSGKVIYTVYVLEAKLVCANGFCISLATEWIRNKTDKDYQKQDCELNAFVRLSKKIKQLYPRLPILMLADGLYPNITGFDSCKENNWPFIFTFKEGNLKTIWEEINLLRPIIPDNEKHWADQTGKWREKHKCCFFSDLSYQKHAVHVLETYITRTKEDTKTNKTVVENNKFGHISSIHINKRNCRQISEMGRLRWVIENQGFNTQKNGGYNLSHKFSRTSHIASCNYYQCLQIAHMINQLAVLQKNFKERFYKDNKETLMAFNEFALAILMVSTICTEMINELVESVGQMRY